MNARLPTQNATSPGSQSVLPDAWISKIFAKLEARYGSMFHDRWKGCDLANVKETWAEELGGFAAQPERIAYALKALADHQFPPTLPEFLAACRRAPATERQQALPYRPTEADVERLKSAVSQAAKAVSIDEYDPLLWAKKPKTQKAMDFVIDGAKRSMALSRIAAEHIQSGVCNEAGKLLKIYEGGGKWASV